MTRFPVTGGFYISTKASEQFGD